MLKGLKGVLFVFCIFSFGFLTSANAAEVRYVSSQKAKLLKAPNFKAEKISNLSLGDSVTVLFTKGPWLQVTTTENKGWLSKFLTKSTPPTDRITVLPSDPETELKDVRRRTSALTTAAAARGLAARSDSESGTLKARNMEAVTYMESFKIDDDDLEIFAEAIRGDQ